MAEAVLSHTASSPTSTSSTLTLRSPGNTVAVSKAAANSIARLVAAQGPLPHPVLREEDFGCLDEVKVFGEEGEEGEEELLLTSAEIEAELTEEKTSLIRETELESSNMGMSRVKEESLRIEAGRDLKSNFPYIYTSFVF